jgi:hypothetical protein
VEVTLRVGKQFDMKEPHLRAGIQARLPSKAATQGYEELQARVQSAIRGR